MNRPEVLEKSRMALLVGGPLLFPLVTLLVSGSEHAVVKVLASWALVAVLYAILRWRQSKPAAESAT